MPWHWLFWRYRSILHYWHRRGCQRCRDFHRDWPTWIWWRCGLSVSPETQRLRRAREASQIGKIIASRRRRFRIMRLQGEIERLDRQLEREERKRQ